MKLLSVALAAAVAVSVLSIASHADAAAVSAHGSNSVYSVAKTGGAAPASARTVPDADAAPATVPAADPPVSTPLAGFGGIIADPARQRVYDQ